MLKKKTIQVTMKAGDRRQSLTEPPSSTANAAPAGLGAVAVAGGSPRPKLAGITMQPNTMPSHRKVMVRSPPESVSRVGARPLLSSSAPTPKPITTMPVANPLWWGNHFATVATGVT